MIDPNLVEVELRKRQDEANSAIANQARLSEILNAEVRRLGERLALAEAVCGEMILEGEHVGKARENDCPLCIKLAAWREGKDK